MDHEIVKARLHQSILPKRSGNIDVNDSRTIGPNDTRLMYLAGLKDNKDQVTGGENPTRSTQHTCDIS